MITVMLQSTGRVLSVGHGLSAALRASPLVCALDTVMMVVEFICLLNVGCCVTTAARLVWYGRFEHGNSQSMLNLPPVSIRDDDQSHLVLNNSAVPVDAHLTAATASTSDPPENPEVPRVPAPPVDDNIPEDTRTSNDIDHQDTTASATGSEAVEDPSTPSTPSQGLQIASTNYLEGSSIDRNWKQSMFAFVIGTVPQALKVFTMRGTPVTQVLMSTYIIAFLVPELFRLRAGSAGEVDLRPMPIVVSTRKSTAEVAKFLCGFVAMAPIFPTNILFLYIAFVRDQINYWSAFGPFCILGMIAVLIQLSVWLSRSPPFTSPLARIAQLWAVDFDRKVLGTPMEVLILSAINPVRECEPLLDGLIFHFVLLIIALMFMPPLLIPLLMPPAHDSPDDRSPDHQLFSDLLAYATLVNLTIVIVVLAIPLMSLFFHGVLFLSLLSKFPRRLTDIKGSMGEFASGYLILSSLVTAFYMYSQLWTLDGTHKPAWADYLG